MSNILKPKYHLTLAHKIVIVMCLFIGISSFFVNKSGYGETCRHETINYFNLLHAGDYMIEVEYSDLPSDTELIVYTKDMADQYDQANLEIARMDLEPGAGEADLQIHIERKLNRIYVVTTADTEDHSFIDKAYANGMQLLDYDNYFMGMLFILTAAAALLLGWYVDRSRYYKPVLLIAIGLLASLPLFSDFLIKIQDMDMRFHFARINGIYEALCAGEFPARINSVQTEGLGNISAIMYPAVFLYPVVFLYFLGISTVLGYKLLLTAINIATAMFAFYSVKNICRSEKMGWIAGIFYTFSMYRLNDMYVRGALGEALAMTFFPLVIWGTYEILYGDRKKWPILMLGMTGVLESHILSTELCGLFLVLQGIVFLFSRKPDMKLKRIMAGIQAAVGTFLLNASFLVPFLKYSGERFVVFSTKNSLSGSAVYISQMFTMFSEVNGANRGRGFTTEEMPLTIGAPLALGALALLVMQTIRRNESKKYSAGIYCLIWGCASLVAATWFFPWGLFSRLDPLESLAAPLQFPWRMLAPASIFLSIAAAAGIDMMSERDKTKWVARTIIVLEFISLFYFFDNMVFYAEAFNKKQAETSTTFDYLYMYAENTDLQNTTIVYDTAGTDAAYYDYDKRGSRVKFDIIPSQPKQEENYLVFPLYYYPGYEVTIDGEKQEALKINDRVACKMPDAAAHVEAYYAGFLSFRIADMITLVTVVVMLAWFGYRAVSGKLSLDFCAKQEYDN